MKKKLLFLLFGCGIICNTLSQADIPQSNASEVFQQEIKVFPNPAGNVINILGLVNSNKAAIVITDMSGNTVQQHRWEIRNNALSIPIPTLRTGIYFVSVLSEEQQVRKKFYKK